MATKVIFKNLVILSIIAFAEVSIRAGAGVDVDAIRGGLIASCEPGKKGSMQTQRVAFHGWYKRLKGLKEEDKEKVLNEVKADSTRTPLYTACLKHNVAAVKLLMKQGARPDVANHPDYNQENPLTYVATLSRESRRVLWGAMNIPDNMREQYKVIVAKGAVSRARLNLTDSDVRDIQQMTPTTKEVLQMTPTTEESVRAASAALFPRMMPPSPPPSETLDLRRTWPDVAPRAAGTTTPPPPTEGQRLALQEQSTEDRIARLAGCSSTSSDEAEESDEEPSTNKRASLSTAELTAILGSGDSSYQSWEDSAVWDIFALTEHERQGT